MAKQLEEDITNLDYQQVIRRSFDVDNDALRVDASLVMGENEVVINQGDDSVAIGDGSTLYTGTDISGKHGLDVNIIAGSVTGEFSESGLKNALKTQSYTVTDIITAIPPVPLINRNSMSIRIVGTGTIYFGNSSVTSSNGYPKGSGEEISLDIKDNTNVQLYAVCDSGQSVEVRILEVS